MRRHRLTCLCLLACLVAAGARAEEECACPPAEKAPPPGLFGTSFLAGWERKFGAGVAGSSGNTDTFDFNADLLGDFENDTRRWKLRSAYYFSGSQDTSGNNNYDRTKHQAYADLLRDFLFPGHRYFLFGQGRYDYDQFEEWTHRLAGALGAGYDFIKTEPFEFRGRLGAGASQTFKAEDSNGKDTDELRPEALVGIEAVWRPLEGQKLSTSHTYYPDLSDPAEFRTLSTLDWIIDVGGSLPLSLKLGILFEHQSDIEKPGRENDLKYGASLLYTF